MLPTHVTATAAATTAINNIDGIELPVDSFGVSVAALMPWSVKSKLYTSDVPMLPPLSLAKTIISWLP